jgi:hypothetical protein
MNLMHEFTPEEARRWDAWQRAGALSARRSDRICRLAGTTIFLAIAMALGAAIWRL